MVFPQGMTLGVGALCRGIDVGRSGGCPRDFSIPPVFLSASEKSTYQRVYGGTLDLISHRPRKPGIAWFGVEDVLLKLRGTTPRIYGDALALMGAMRTAGIDVGLWSMSRAEEIRAIRQGIPPLMEYVSGTSRGAKFCREFGRIDAQVRKILRRSLKLKLERCPDGMRRPEGMRRAVLKESGSGFPMPIFPKQGEILIDTGSLAVGMEAKVEPMSGNTAFLEYLSSPYFAGEAIALLARDGFWRSFSLYDRSWRGHEEFERFAAFLDGSGEF